MAQNGLLLIADIAGYTMFLALVRVITQLAKAKQPVSEQRASKIALERLVAEDIAAPVA